MCFYHLPSVFAGFVVTWGGLLDSTIRVLERFFWDFGRDSGG